jgi:thiamine-monophosphate kinase
VEDNRQSMPDDSDESFVIQTVLQHRPASAVRAAPAGRHGLEEFAPGDDAAVVPDNTVVTVDAMVEGVHWDPKLSPADVGWKLIAANASDINAMGATPLWAVLTLCLPRPLDREWVKSFSQGLGEALEAWSIELVGGDTTRSPAGRMASLTLTGRSAHPIGRHSAQVGDDVWVSGSLGGPAAGFFVDGASLDALRRPMPPIGLGAALGSLPTSMMDISDGMATDLARLCEASQLGAEIQPSALPKHPTLEQHPDPIPLMVGFGEEYELLFTSPPKNRAAIDAVGLQFGHPVTRIGILNEHAQVGPQLMGRAWPPPLFSHFSEADA